RHPECAANLRLEMVNLAGEAVGRQPLGHGFRIEEGAKNLFRLGGEDAMQTNGIALGHGFIFSIITERTVRRIWLGQPSLCPKDAGPPYEPTWGKKEFPTRGAPVPCPVLLCMGLFSRFCTALRRRVSALHPGRESPAS